MAVTSLSVLVGWISDVFSQYVHCYGMCALEGGNSSLRDDKPFQPGWESKSEKVLHSTLPLPCFTLLPSSSSAQVVLSMQRARRPMASTLLPIFYDCFKGKAEFQRIQISLCSCINRSFRLLIMVLIQSIWAAACLLVTAAVKGKTCRQAQTGDSSVLTTPTAHPAPHSPSNSVLLLERAEKAKRCSSQVGAMKAKRHQMRKRELQKRGLRPGIDDTDTTYVIHAEAPKYDFLKNDTCILAPEITQGPYWYPPHEILRQDMTENEVGVPLELDIGLIDVHSCLPLDNVLLSLWHCNASGSYSSFDYDPNTPFETLLKENGIDDPSKYDNWAVSLLCTTAFVMHTDFIKVPLQQRHHLPPRHVANRPARRQLLSLHLPRLLRKFPPPPTFLRQNLTSHLGRAQHPHPRPSLHRLDRHQKRHRRLRPHRRNRTNLLRRGSLRGDHGAGALC